LAGFSTGPNEHRPHNFVDALLSGVVAEMTWRNIVLISAFRIFHSAFRIFQLSDVDLIAQKMSSEAMNLSAVDGQDSSAERPGGHPLFLPQRPIEHLDPIVLAGLAQARDRGAGSRMIERVTFVAALGVEPASATGESLDTLDDGIGHARHDKSPGRWLSRCAPGHDLQTAVSFILRGAAPHLLMRTGRPFR
jgi:hypothetical protein